ncbi:MAG: glucosamine-6-phosphate deaminase [Oscillospiraceae bacterium]|nr:glucosamine-6-phosphate deaminase [Oscillospiraceae bacterium]
MIKQIEAGLLLVNVYGSRGEMGEAVTADVISAIGEVLAKQEECNIIFAAAPSQNELLSGLASGSGIDWSRINAFHMDEYIGLHETAPQRFGNFLKSRLFDKAGFLSVNYIDGNNDPDFECKRYGDLLKKHKIDIVCGGIGENCHIAFNDPHVADFNDNALIKTVDLDEKCRTQQVNDGCFDAIDDVPKQALTVTIPVLLSAKYFFCTVPAVTKAKAVYNTVNQPISEQYPSTILRNHPNTKMYTDTDSASLI